MRGLLYIVILFVVTGCGYSGAGHAVLDEAQRLMPGDPVAAFERLNSIDVSELGDSATMARWALLYSEAMVANRLSAPTDTIVNIAVDYYGRHRRYDEFNRASKLKALIAANENKDALATALYLQKEKEFMLYKERVKRGQVVFAGLIVLLFATGAIVWMHQRLKLKSLQNETLVAEASGLKNMVDAYGKDMGRLEETLYGLLENRFALIDSLCQTYYEAQGTRIERKAIVEKVKSEIEAVRNDSFHDMEQAVNDCRGNILVRLRKIYPDIKPADYQLAVYMECGLSTRTVSLLLGESVDVVYKRKSRLKSRLKAVSGTSDADILSIF